MIQGSFSGGYPLLEVPFRLSNRPVFTIEFVIDTGFAGQLALPPLAVATLELPFLYRMSANLANDTGIRVDVHTATILWHGEERKVEVLSMGSRPLLGKALLLGSETCIQFTDSGLLTINRL